MAQIVGVPSGGVVSTAKSAGIDRRVDTPVLSYEQMLGELQGLLGANVGVVIVQVLSPDDAPVVARLRGPLLVGRESTDVLDGGELIVFGVGSDDDEEVSSYFTIRRRLFDTAAWIEHEAVSRHLMIDQGGLRSACSRLTREPRRSWRSAAEVVRNEADPDEERERLVDLAHLPVPR